jgi:hypothetical protein
MQKCCVVLQQTDAYVNEHVVRQSCDGLQSVEPVVVEDLGVAIQLKLFQENLHSVGIVHSKAK